jgi:hypothetical protein
MYPRSPQSDLFLAKVLSNGTVSPGIVCLGVDYHTSRAASQVSSCCCCCRVFSRVMPCGAGSMPVCLILYYQVLAGTPCRKMIVLGGDCMIHNVAAFWIRQAYCYYTPEHITSQSRILGECSKDYAQAYAL